MLDLTYEPMEPEGHPDEDYEYWLETHWGADRVDETFSAHCEAWPNGYGFCSTPFCLQEIYHDGPCTEATDAEYEAHLHRHDEVA